MLFWAAAAVLTVLCVAAALYPLFSQAGAAADAQYFDLEVYKDQLAELGGDEAAGLIAAGEAETARAEISRRILSLSNLSAAGQRGAGKMRGLAAISVAALVPVLSWGGYALVGAPEMPDQPILSRNLTAPGADSIAALVAKAEAHLSSNPDDGRGWDVLAPIYARMGRLTEAASAYRKAIELNGETAMRLTGLGEVLTAAAGGKVSGEAKTVFARAASLDPNEPKAALFLASGLAQDGRREEARARLEALLVRTPADAEWRPVIERALASLSGAAPEMTAKGPSQQQIEAASQMSGDDRLAMIEGMVGGLAARLKENPDNIEDWQKLIRSYVVLGKGPEAGKAFGEAKAAFANDAAKLSAIRTFAKEIGLNPS